MNWFRIIVQMETLSKDEVGILEPAVLIVSKPRIYIAFEQTTSLSMTASNTRISEVLQAYEVFHHCTVFGSQECIRRTVHTTGIGPPPHRQKSGRRNNHFLEKGFFFFFSFF